MLLCYAQTYGHVLGWAKPSVFLGNNSTLAFTRELAQLKVNNSEFLVFGRLMRPPVLTSAGGRPLPETSWCQEAWRGQTCCHTTQVIGQVWMANDGSLGLALANPSSNATVSVTAKLRVDGHTHLTADGGALVDGVPVTVGPTHLEITKSMPPLSAAVVHVSPAFAPAIAGAD